MVRSFFILIAKLHIISGGKEVHGFRKLLLGRIARNRSKTGILAEGQQENVALWAKIRLRPGNNHKFQAEISKEVLVERGYADVAQAWAKLETHPMEVYAYLDGRILFDPEGMLTQLRELAKEIFEAYRISDNYFVEKRKSASTLLSS